MDIKLVCVQTENHELQLKHVWKIRVRIETEDVLEVTESSTLH